MSQKTIPRYGVIIHTSTVAYNDQHIEPTNLKDPNWPKGYKVKPKRKRKYPKRKGKIWKEII
jgi:hypothetical protein